MIFQNMTCPRSSWNKIRRDQHTKLIKVDLWIHLTGSEVIDPYWALTLAITGESKGKREQGGWRGFEERKS